jgi:hypothetical protein
MIESSQRMVWHITIYVTEESRSGGSKPTPELTNDGLSTSASSTPKLHDISLTTNEGRSCRLVASTHLAQWEAKGAGVDISYAFPQAHKIVNVALHWEYSPVIVFIFSQGRKELYHV